MGFAHSSTVLVAQGKSKEGGSADATVLCHTTFCWQLWSTPLGSSTPRSLESPPGPRLFRAVSRQSSQVNGKLHTLSTGEKELRYEFLLSWNVSRIHSYFSVHVFWYTCTIRSPQKDSIQTFINKWVVIPQVQNSVSLIWLKPLINKLI